ncbi:sulfotransferase [Paracoccus sp. MBLB3053]|uniref:Sulfotransferase n=1 Tax=Paracoccus aurantius TaxID=3073814 RepID=A0ABU2HV68_9RHOB|nr:sulfotransferase [Paracoccus sp. MBLB3053]MDS9468937.1 sulfotransferase [Paracoccus sp. MBLB3053]
MQVDRPILVTGCPRSGTTWTGNVIGAAREVFLIYEPFNDDVGARLRLPERFMRLTDGNSAPHRQEIDDLIALGRLSRRSALAMRGIAERWRPGEKRYTPGWLAFRRLHSQGQDFFGPRRVCIKDPIAFYSSEWLADTYDAQVIVMVRHPCSVIASYLSLGWESEVEAMLPHPVPEGFAGLRDEIEARNGPVQDRLTDLILQWKLFTAETLDLQRRRPDWTYILHDDLCLRPLHYFEAIFAKLGLSFTSDIADKVRRESSGTKNAANGKPVQHRHERDSRSVIDAWQEKLPGEIAERILRETAELWEEAQRRLLT